MNHSLDAALLAALQASALKEPPKPKARKSSWSRLVIVSSDDDGSVRASVDRSKFVPFANRIKCCGIGTSLNA